MPNGTNIGNAQSHGNVNDTTNTFGTISLLHAVDTTTPVEFPMKKGFHTLEIVPEDFMEPKIDTTATLTDTTAIVEIPATDTETVEKIETVVAEETAQVDTVVAETPAVEEQKPFTEFDEKVFRINYTKIGDIDNGWMFWGLLLCFVTYCITKIIFPKRMESVFSHALQYNFAEKEFHKSNENSQIVTFVMNFLFAFCMGLFAFFALKINYNWEFSTIKEILFTLSFTLFFLLLYFFKKQFYHIVAIIFDREPYAQECSFNIYLINRVLGICLFPINIALAFVKPTVISSETLLIIGYVIIGFFYIFRIFREFQISKKNRVSLFYIFLYFCMLEILPILLLIKVLTSIVFVEFSSL